MLKLVFPLIGSMPISAVTTEDVLRVLQQPVEKRGASEPGSLWTLKPDPASRLRAKLEALFDWAAVHGHRTGDNPARWRGHLAHVLVPSAKLHNGGHQPALPYVEVPAFVAALRCRASSPSADALFFLILTAARSQEVRLAEWPEVDREAGLWTIPAERMKAGRAHRVPLSGPALALLKRTPPIAGTRLVWPGQGLAKPMSDMTLAAVVRKMHAAELRGAGRGWVDPRSGRAAVPHGFRSTFRDWAAEQTSYPSEMAEMALAHRVGSAVEQAYRRTDMLERRRNMMDDWAKFATGYLNS